MLSGLADSAAAEQWLRERGRSLSRRPGRDLLASIGGTPLLPLEALTADLRGVRLLGKAEWLNPGGSVKDRAAARIVLEARRSGELRPGRRLLDATSGNTGIAYAMLGAALGFGVTLCLPANASPERRQLLRAYGAEVILTDAGEGSDGAIARARELAASDPERWYYADQYSNDQNWRAHYHGTAEEIWRQTRGRITHFVAMLGTSGTFVGASRRLKELNPRIRCVSLQPDGPLHGIEGAKHMASALVPPIYDPSLADDDLGVSTEAAQGMARRMARRMGLLVGVSAGAAVAGSLEVARRLGGEPAVIVTVLCDSGARYLSERFWEGEE
ncbi:MAG TPA: cysteine synthase family protein [Anaeromyxobacteraceae bacterium]|nr:cysteine synthase family protein [Anaeromyxobacteraceae bacterium]